jgi:hypothetical protein
MVNVLSGVVANSSLRVDDMFQSASGATRGRTSGSGTANLIINEGAFKFDLTGADQAAVNALPQKVEDLIIRSAKHGRLRAVLQGRA